MNYLFPRERLFFSPRNKSLELSSSPSPFIIFLFSPFPSSFLISPFLFSNPSFSSFFPSCPLRLLPFLFLALFFSSLFYPIPSSSLSVFNPSFSSFSLLASLSSSLSFLYPILLLLFFNALSLFFFFCFQSFLSHFFLIFL